MQKVQRSEETHQKTRRPGQERSHSGEQHQKDRVNDFMMDNKITCAHEVMLSALSSDADSFAEPSNGSKAVDVQTDQE